MKSKLIEAAVEKLFHLYESQMSKEYIGEPVTILEHSVQTAQIAESEDQSFDVILAAFLHDVGHLLPTERLEDQSAFGNLRHEVAGAKYLASLGFSKKVVFLVENHVQAKRYLTFKSPAYYESLSEASRETLKHQGGVMTAAEAVDFEDNPLFETCIKMRQWDEKAKVPNQAIPDLYYYKIMAFEHLLAVNEPVYQ